MIHFLAGLIFCCILLGNAWAKCDEKPSTVNIPLVIDGKQACYHQSSSLNVRTEKIKDKEYVEYEITPLEADFENVPSSGTYQYLYVDYDEAEKASQVYLMSFLCSGETPIGGDAFSDSLLKLSTNSQEASANIDVFIATGLAADNLSVSQAKKARAKVFDRFLEIFEEKAENISAFESESSNIYVPNVMAGAAIHSVTSVERKLYSSFFSRTNSSINGCSKQFISSMQDYLIDNVVKNDPFKNITVKKKRFSSKLKMKWSL